jgi:hypothetical protein
MILRDTPDVYGFTIFCDDIREEVGGKFTFIGSYIEKMFVQGTFPLALPKFGLGVTTIQRAHLFAPLTKILVFMPGDGDDQPSITADLPTDASQLEIPKPNGEHAQPIVRSGTNLVFSPLPIKQPGLMKVRAVRNNELIRCGLLQIEAQAPPEVPPAA